MVLCERFHLSPFELRKERLTEFCLLIKRLDKHTKHQKAKPKTKDGKEQNFIPVTDYEEGKGGGE